MKMNTTTAKRNKKRIFVCCNDNGEKNPSCLLRGSNILLEKLQNKCDKIEVVKSPCMGRCSFGPIVKIHGGPFFQKVSENDFDNIIKEALK